MNENGNNIERAILIGLVTPEQSVDQLNEYFDELQFLTGTAGAVTVSRFYQKIKHANPRTYVGKGKLDEIHINEGRMQNYFLKQSLNMGQHQNLKRLIVILLCLLPMLVHGQLLTFGPKIGINLSEIKVSESFSKDGISYHLVTGEDGRGFVGGGFARIKIASLFIQPEILYSQEQSSLTLISGGTDETFDVRTDKTDIPIMVGLILGNILRLQVGPVISNYNRVVTKPEQGLNWQNLELTTSDRTWGYQLGAGLDIGRVLLDARIEGPVTPVQMSIEIDGDQFTFNPGRTNYQLTIGYKLIK